MGKPWSEWEIKKMIELFDNGDGLNFVEIGKKIGRGRASVRVKLISLGYYNSEKTLNKEYLYKVGEVVNETLKIVEQIRIPDKTGKKCKGYLVQSLMYPDTKPYEKTERHLKRGQGCAYTSGNKTCPENSLYTHTEIHGNLINIKQAKTIPPNYTKKVLFQCDNEDCKNTKKMLPYNLIRQGFGCQVCGRGKSYPELYFMSYSDVMCAGFIPEQTFEDFKDHRFDFVNYEKRIIVETHGMAHYKEIGGHMDHKRTVASDKRKRKYCKENNWTLIELDCRISSFEHIRKSIANEPLLENITEKNIKDMLEIMKKNKRYPTKEIIELYTLEMLTAREIGKIFNFSESTIGRILDRNNIETRRGKVLNESDVIDLYTNKKVSSIKIANIYEVSSSTIIRILENNNTPRRDASDYERGASPNRKKVKCITTGVTFNSVTKAQEWAIQGSKISEVCKGKRKTAGKHPVTGEKLYWEYV